MVKLYAAYPADIGMLVATVFAPDRSGTRSGRCFSRAGDLHAYLDGLGVELMANSDNVLRGGLTPKHVNVSELLRVLSFHERGISILSPKFIDPMEGLYDTPADEFALSVIAVRGGAPYRSPQARSIEILLCTEGEAVIELPARDETLEIGRGTSVMVPAAAPRVYN